MYYYIDIYIYIYISIYIMLKKNALFFATLQRNIEFLLKYWGFLKVSQYKKEKVHRNDMIIIKP
jgi:hypoxanthine-guanine phosphoribosyltransferase